ncbi:hypothetical protein ACFYVK_38080 [Streptomyces chartreusis]|uniref:hypothetical protein n=1 Tax=Streptomyces chartreusis TaxID=1969 RepID=UPI00367F49E5
MGKGPAASGQRGLRHARLLLRILKAGSVRVGKACHDRYVELSDSFEYCYAVVDDGLEVDWPPLDTDRRDGTWNFGLSELTSRFAGEWHDRTRLEVVRETAGSDDVGQTPGTAAALLLEDVTRLASRTVQPHWQGVPGADAARVLEQVVTRVDPDLGFRLFLRVLIALWMPLTAERYARFEALGKRFGHGKYLVSEIDQFIRSDL